MKIIFTILFIFLIGMRQIIAQEGSFCLEPVDVYFSSGKVMKQIKQWRLDTVRMEYVYDGNLSDVLVGDVNRIVLKNYEITFDVSGYPVKRKFDFIIIQPGDSIRGFIVEVMNDNFVAYIPAKGNSVKETFCEGFILNETSMRNVPVKYPQVKEKSIQKPTASDKRNRIYPGAKKPGKAAMDLIISRDGDSIYCIILSDEKLKIIYDVPAFGNNLRATIPKRRLNGIVLTIITAGLNDMIL